MLAVAALPLYPAQPTIWGPMMMTRCPVAALLHPQFEMPTRSCFRLPSPIKSSYANVALRQRPRLLSSVVVVGRILAVWTPLLPPTQGWWMSPQSLPPATCMEAVVM